MPVLARGMSRIHVYDVPKEVHKMLKRVANDQDISQNELMKEAVILIIEKYTTPKVTATSSPPETVVKNKDEEKESSIHGSSNTGSSEAAA